MTLRDRHARSNPCADELTRVLFSDDVDGLVLLYGNQFDGYALLQLIMQKSGYSIINPRSLVSSTGDDVRYNAWLTIAEPPGENYCAFNFD